MIELKGDVRKSIVPSYFPTGVEVDDLALRISMSNCAGRNVVILNNVPLSSRVYLIYIVVCAVGKT